MSSMKDMHKVKDSFNVENQKQWKNILLSKLEQIELLIIFLWKLSTNGGEVTIDIIELQDISSENTSTTIHEILLKILAFC
jgi:hypothetical protein